ncbi:unnamed protein product [Dovyalis caffra]|uniref:15-cis-phytoene synthase n=1 Tax=Dovyalis caffra TaxID=77055 RepID=A0AAV1RSW6_9ROSI|nr:unnamed protein product [Dovyalis caffra]
MEQTRAGSCIHNGLLQEQVLKWTHNEGSSKHAFPRLLKEDIPRIDHRVKETVKRQLSKMPIQGQIGTSPCSGGNNGRFMHPKSVVTRTRCKGISAHKCSSSRAFPRLLKEVIPPAELHVQEIVKRQSQANNLAKQDSCRRPECSPVFLEEAYRRCRNICKDYAGTYYLGSLLMTEERQKAIWAIYAWGTRIDEMVDGPNAVYMSTSLLDSWEERLQDIFDGHPYDMVDAALTDTVSKFCLDIKPFKDMIEGMRMDTRKCRYENFQELYLYCYYVAGTTGLMTVPILGIKPESSVSVQSIYNAAVYFGIANQLTNILRDVQEDALRGRIYLPQDELAQFGLSDKDVFARKVTDNWREIMKEQIARARFYYNLAEQGISHLDKASHWPLWSSLLLYQQILDSIEDNDYDNLTKRAYVGRTKKFLLLSQAYRKA